MDYNGLIERLREVFAVHPGIYLAYVYCEEAATAIETLLAERDAMESDLLAFRTCSTCANAEENSGRGEPCAFGPVCTGQYWKWRGPQKEAKLHGH